MNYEIAGKKLDEDFACYVCGQPMSPVQLESRIDGEPFYMDRGLLEYHPSYRTVTVEFRCQCGVGCELEIPDRAFSVVNREPQAPEIWEYIIMSVTSVKYGRVKNLGNCETERIEAEVILDGDQDADEALIEARTFVNKKLGLGPTSDEVEAAIRILEEAGEL